jgi:hypothetical protein
MPDQEKEKTTVAAVNEAPAVAPAPAAEQPAAAKEQPAPAASTDTASWASPAETPWEVEAKKASMFASTWDLPAPPPPAPVTPSDAAVTAAENLLAAEPAAESPQATSEAVTEFVQQDSAPSTAEYGEEAKVDATEAPAGESAYASGEDLLSNDTQEIPVYTESASSYASAPVTEEVVSHAVEEPPHAPETVEEMVYEDEPVAEAAPAPVPVAASQPDMDELVERVLAKMNPDVLQKMTQEILRPVIEALIKDELNAKK